MTEIEKTNIKELVNIIGNAELSNKCHSDCFINTDFDNECSLCRSATALFKAGYRKQSDTIKEVAEKLKIKLTDKSGWVTYKCQDLCWDIDKIAKEYGVEVE